MTFADMPWLELAILATFFGLIAVLRAREAMPWATGACSAAFVFALGEWLCHYAKWVAAPGSRSLPGLAVDGFSAPLLPLACLIHLLTALATPRAEGGRGYFAGLMVSLAIQLTTFGCTEPWLLIALLAVGTLPPAVELLGRGRGARLFLVHMLLFIALLAGGWACVEAGRPVLGGSMLLVAILVRCGTVPVHTWVPGLFDAGRFGTALVFVVPLVGVYAAVRLAVPTAPEWVLRGLGAFSLATALVAAGLAVVQREARRLYSYLLLSHGALVLVGLELLSPLSLTGSLALWLAVALSMTGLGLTMRAVEARFGRLSLGDYLGLYGQSPTLAGCFLLMGLASVGFPGTLGFVAGELVVDGAVTDHPLLGLGVVLAGLLNSVAVMRAYFLLFTGTRHETAVPLGITMRERVAVLVLSILIIGGGLYPQPGIFSRYEAAREVLGKRPGAKDVAENHH